MAGVRQISVEAPVFAALQWMRARGQLTLCEVASSQAIGIGPRRRIRSDHRLISSDGPEGNQLLVVYKAPLLHHAPPLRFVCAVPDQRGLATVIRTSITRLRFMASVGLNTELHQAVGWSPVLRGSGDFSFSVEGGAGRGKPAACIPISQDVAVVSQVCRAFFEGGDG